MFGGTSEHTLDEKLRLVLPKKDREIFGTVVVALLNFDRAVSLYSKESYDKIAAGILALSDYNPNARKIKRIFFANSYELTVDKVGRIMLPKKLCDDSNITKEVTVVGAGDHIEVWDKNRFAEDQNTGEDNFSCLAESMMIGK